MLSGSKACLNLIASPLVRAEQLLVRSVALWILRWPSLSLTRAAYVVPGAEVPILAVDGDVISADSLGVTAVLLLVCLGLWDHVLGLIAWIPTDPVLEGKTSPHRDTGLPQAEALRARSANSTAALVWPRTLGRTWRRTRFTIGRGMLRVLA